MYRITIHRIESNPNPTEPHTNIDVDIYSQLFEELDVADLIARINHKPRTRRAAKKGTAK